MAWFLLDGKFQAANWINFGDVYFSDWQTELVSDYIYAWIASHSHRVRSAHDPGESCVYSVSDRSPISVHGDQPQEAVRRAYAVSRPLESRSTMKLAWYIQFRLNV